MAKRDKDTITLGSGELFLKEYLSSADIDYESLCVEANLLGYIKGGANLTYTQETYEEKDDLGRVSKIITTSEEVLLKSGILTWNGNTLKKLVDNCTVSESGGKRTTKLGGAGNAQNKNYAIGFKHSDKTDGNVWVVIKGKNTAGLTISFAKDTGTVIDAEFKAMPQDENGTLVQIIEEIETGSQL